MQKIFKNIRINDINLVRDFIISCLQETNIILLNGNLGSGKTELSKNIISYLISIDQVEVKSPTFNLVSSYQGYSSNLGKNIEINHYDLYRIKEESELEMIGIYDDVLGSAIKIIEWPDLLRKRLKYMNYIDVEILNNTEGGSRNFIIKCCDIVL